MLRITFVKNIKKYSKQLLLKAVNSSYDWKTAAKRFYVPASTIRRHDRDYSLIASVGRPAYLTIDEEAYFVSILRLFPAYSFNASKEIFSQLANDYYLSLGLEYRLGDK